MAAKMEVVIGEQYSRLKIIRDAGKNRHSKTLVECECDCGKTCTVILSRLRNGLTKSCGCYKREVTSETSRVDYTGVVSGKLTMLKDVGTDGGTRLWLCKCECGNFHTAKGSSVKFGHILSCGCLQLENTVKANTTHGMSDTREYWSYHKMLDRCYNENDHKYPSYGARGITVCDRWLESFSNFYEDMGDKPENLSLERKDVNGNYEPDNCMWDTATEQAFNQRKSKANTSGKSGVNFITERGLWSARIGKENKEYRLGVFATFEEAVEARQKAELELYGYLKDGGNA